MPRKSRFYLPGVPVHIVQRGHCREPVFFDRQDYVTYLHWVKVSAKKYEVSVHAFVLMTNHVHFLITPSEVNNPSLFMQYIGRRYVPYINHKYGRSGSLWEGRYKASLVQEEGYFLKVMKYIELNPVRASMVDAPNLYRWSSFCHNGGAKAIEFLTCHDIYLSLGSSKSERTDAYIELFKYDLCAQDMRRIRDSWQTGTPLGNDYFLEQVERQLVCKVGQARRGRPRIRKSE
ncbi:transposase [Arenicella xantha]|uniref:Putative transposase n=1 Tax=Arenicella xantha TaxID=644221 RepID=A0A395JTJ4_9GAMM|nr:transposase [Arenicella xantha]RBP52898.1 putative transposase [Arenicella xantha]